MLRAGALMAALLVLVPFTGWSVRGRLLVLCEVWPGHLKEYQQLSVAADNDSYRTLVNRILVQSALKKDNRNYKSFRTNFKIHGKNAFKNNQQNYAVLFRINLYLLADKKTSIQISKKHSVMYEVILRERNYLRRRLSILMNANLEDCEVKMNWHINVRKKSEGNKSQVSYFEKGYKYMETRSPLTYMAHQSNILKSEEQLPKSQKSLGSIIILKFVKQRKGEDHIEMKILKKKKCKNNIDRLLASVKEKFCKVNTNVYNKNQHRIFSDGKKLFNTERKKQYIGFKRLQQRKNIIKEKIKMWKQKTITKKSVYDNQKLQFRHVFTYQRNSHRLQKVYSTHKKMLANIQRKKVPAFQTKTYRGKHLIQKWGSILRARKESKFGENEMGILSKIYYMQPFIVNLKFLTITMYVKQDFFSSEKYQTEPLVQVKKMLQYLLPSSERVKKKYFSLGQKGLEMSALKTLMVKRLVKKEGFPAFFYNNIFNGPSSIVERTKRSAKNKTVPISVGVLQHLSSALIAGATIFGIALFIIVLAGFYLYLKRRIFILYNQRTQERNRQQWQQRLKPLPKRNLIVLV
ncbi:uncharacterized protein LOC134493407 isoform X2 [Candoia aspera]|uniref:uncharacterized protein LOC134493407 isoform X2 n=1 Tax=Candoia aspera TaxID=51853 RepID=UPI002FD7CD4B